MRITVESVFSKSCRYLLTKGAIATSVLPDPVPEQATSYLPSIMGFMAVS